MILQQQNKTRALSAERGKKHFILLIDTISTYFEVQLVLTRRPWSQSVIVQKVKFCDAGIGSIMRWQRKSQAKKVGGVQSIKGEGGPHL